MVPLLDLFVFGRFGAYLTLFAYETAATMVLEMPTNLRSANIVYSDINKLHTKVKCDLNSNSRRRRDIKDHIQPPHVLHAVGPTGLVHQQGDVVILLPL